MVFRLIRRLMGLGVSVVLVLGVAGHLGPQLAARSMTGYVRVFDAAQAGNYAEASSISAQLEREWRGLGTQVTTAVSSLMRTVSHALDGR